MINYHNTILQTDIQVKVKINIQLGTRGTHCYIYIFKNKHPIFNTSQSNLLHFTPSNRISHILYPNLPPPTLFSHQYKIVRRLVTRSRWVSVIYWKTEEYKIVRRLVTRSRWVSVIYWKTEEYKIVRRLVTRSRWVSDILSPPTFLTLNLPPPTFFYPQSPTPTSCVTPLHTEHICEYPPPPRRIE